MAEREANSEQLDVPSLPEIRFRLFLERKKERKKTRSLC